MVDPGDSVAALELAIASVGIPILALDNALPLGVDELVLH